MIIIFKNYDISDKCKKLRLFGVWLIDICESLEFISLFYSTSVVSRVFCCLVVISGFWTWFWRIMEQSGRLGMIGIELNQGIGRWKSIFVELAVGEKQFAAGEKPRTQIPGANSPRRDFS